MNQPLFNKLFLYEEKSKTAMDRGEPQCDIPLEIVQIFPFLILAW